MLKTLLCDENNRFLVVEEAEAISEILKRKDRHLWLDLERPTAEELDLIQEEFRLHPLAIEDATKRHQRPKIDEYEDFYFVVFYSVAKDEPGKEVPSTVRRGIRGSRFHGPEWESVAAPPDEKPEERESGLHIGPPVI